MYTYVKSYVCVRVRVRVSECHQHGDNHYHREKGEKIQVKQHARNKKRQVKQQHRPWETGMDATHSSEFVCVCVCTWDVGRERLHIEAVQGDDSERESQRKKQAIACQGLSVYPLAW